MQAQWLSALPTGSQVLNLQILQLATCNFPLSELANRGCAFAWRQDKVAQRCSLVQGPLTRQTVEMPPLPAQPLSVCKPDGEHRPGCSTRVPGTAVTQPLQLQGTPRRQSGMLPPLTGGFQHPSEGAARCGRVDSQGS